jgi:hypothetical protein
MAVGYLPFAISGMSKLEISRNPFIISREDKLTAVGGRPSAVVERR